ncbi:MAG: J domain-containing protein [Candidatus Scalindua sp.]|jgi:hypothetical protein|nr:J domain-containing protein [Candidatus Scalindua sp.]
MTNYFTTTEIPEIKAEFRRLAMLNHPDKGGEKAVMQEIISQYHNALKGLNGAMHGPENTWKYTYNYQYEQDIVDKLTNIAHLDGIIIEIKGSWIWVSGNTKPVKETLKKEGFRWSRNKNQWYWHNPKDAWKKHGKPLSANEITHLFGSKRYKAKKKDKEESLVIN